MEIGCENLCHNAVPSWNPLRRQENGWALHTSVVVVTRLFPLSGGDSETACIPQKNYRLLCTQDKEKRQ